VTGRPSDGLLAWAAVGSRISGFHHDSASKLQSLMMALDEAQDLLGESRPDVAQPLETAMTALKELHGLLTENRALAKAPARKDVALADVMKRAAARVGVTCRGDAPAVTVHVAPPSIVHALALLCDAIASSNKSVRAIDTSYAVEPERVAITLTGTAPAASELDAITVATWLLEREEGAVFSAPNGFTVHVPKRVQSSAAKP
jgi:hypothetical protein